MGSYIQRTVKYGALDDVGKLITSLLFFILPYRITEAFIKMSFAALVCKVKTGDARTDKNLAKLNELLNTNYNVSQAALPSYTLSWIWPEYKLEDLPACGGDRKPISEILSNVDNEVASGTVVNELYKSFPYLLRWKVRLSGESSKERLLSSLEKFWMESKNLQFS